MRFYQKFQYSYQYNYNTSTNLISRIQNNSWNSLKFSGVKKTPYTVYSQVLRQLHCKKKCVQDTKSASTVTSVHMAIKFSGHYCFTVFLKAIVI